jgi:hypothetical protein
VQAGVLSATVGPCLSWTAPRRMSAISSFILSRKSSWTSGVRGRLLSCLMVRALVASETCVLIHVRPDILLVIVVDRATDRPPNLAASRKCSNMRRSAFSFGGLYTLQPA